MFIRVHSWLKMARLPLEKAATAKGADEFAVAGGNRASHGDDARPACDLPPFKRAVVDRHVLRVSNRIGVAASDDPVVVEQQLCAALPPPKWIVASDTFILHGRRICKPRPLCDRCAVRDGCDFYRAAMGVVPRRSSPTSET